MPKQALIIGATGLIGSHLSNLLAESDAFSKVVTLTRRAAPHASPKVENIVVDFERLQDHAAQFQTEVFFSCLGTTRRQAGSLAAQRTVDVDYQLQAAKLAAQGGAQHYLLVSSSGADANSRSAYLKMKGELEQQVLQLPFPRISIFRPSLLLGERDHMRPAETFASWFLPLLCTLPGLRRYRPIQGAQVAEKMLQVSTTPGPARQGFTLDEIFPD
ncbi:hypothetical protein Maes01_02120 [Microbulbifer aestuariivivens]|uniref:NAD-dependent epimerase/dehydratase domain-containing protein n=1 Tax=Microbulbifer aestuariivivens TaxID=1908308 RepID=A0ABP9WTT7_9GAMM